MAHWDCFPRIPWRKEIQFFGDWAGECNVPDEKQSYDLHSMQQEGCCVMAYFGDRCAILKPTTKAFSSKNNVQ
jgi:hypothetical protein